jgi:hypothetical protein
MALLSKKMALAVASETTQASAATISASTDFIRLIEKPTVTPITEQNQRASHREAFGQIPFVTGHQYAEVNFKMEMAATGSTNTAYAPLHAALKACGFTASGGTGGTDWTFTTISANVSQMFGPATSATIEVFLDGLKHQVIGCVGKFKAVMEAGKIPYYDFSFKGNYVAVSDTAIPSITYTDTTPPVIESATLVIDNAAQICSKVEIDVDNKIEMIPDVNSATGLKGFRITDREIKASVNPEMVLVATYSFWSKYMAGTALASGANGLNLVAGTVAKNKTTFDAPNAQIKSAKYNDRNGIIGLDVELQLNDTATMNDALSIVIDNA